MSAKFTLEGSSSGAVQAIQQAADALDKTGKAAEGAAKSTRQLTNEAQRIKESIDPQERLNRKYAELQQHVDAGRISISQATAAGIKYRQELYAASEEGKRAAAAAIAASQAQAQAAKDAEHRARETAKAQAQAAKDAEEASRRRAEGARRSTQIQLDAGQRLLKLEKEQAAVVAQAAREQQQLTDAALKIREAINPQEKLNRLTQDLANHVKSGRLSIEEATTAHRKYRHELGLTAAAGQDVENSNEKAFGASALSSMTSYLTGLVSIGTAFTVIRGELDAMAERAERRAQLSMTTADAEAGLRKVVGPDPQGDAMLAGATSIAEKSRLPLAQVYQAATSAYGATSSVPISIAALSEATRQSRDPEAIREIASGIGFVMGSTGIKDPREAAGLLNQVLAGSPIEDAKVPQAYAKVSASYLSPTAGGSAATAGAILAGLSQASADTEGDRSRTGAIDLITKSDEFFKKRGRKYGVSADAADTVDERIALLMANPEMAKDFIASTKFEAPVRGGMSRLFLTEEGRASFAANRAAMSDTATRNSVADRTAAFLTGGKLQSGKKANEIISSGSDMFELGKENVLTRESYDKLIGMIADQWGGPAPNMSARAYYGMTTGVGGVDTLEAIHMLQSNRPEGSGETAQKFDAMIGELRALREQQKSKVSTRPE